MANDFEKINIKHASLFTGIGGFDYAAEQIGWQNIFQCEIDEWSRKILKQNFPTVTQYADIKETDFAIYRGRIDVLTGGFPCQPHSKAGKKLGAKDERDLWYECKRTVSQIRPSFALFENVSALLTTDAGRFFNRVLSDLAEIGYDAEWACLPASAFGAPHIRERIWIISYPCGDFGTFGFFGGNGTETKGRNKETKIRSENRNEFEMGTTLYSGIRGDKEWLPEPEFPKLVNGLPDELVQIKGYGNAIVPKVALEIFRPIDFILKGRKKN